MDSLFHNGHDLFTMTRFTIIYLNIQEEWHSIAPIFGALFIILTNQRFCDTLVRYINDCE